MEILPKIDIYLDINDVCQKYKLHKKTIYNWQCSGKFPRAEKLGTLSRWKLSTLERWERQAFK